MAGKSELTFRAYEAGKDENIWIEMNNKAYKDFPDFTPMTMDEMLNYEKGPWFHADDLFFVELDGSPIGVLEAYVDPNRTDKKGFLDVALLPEWRGRGFAKKMLAHAITHFKSKGIESIQGGCPENFTIAIRVFEKSGFKKVREFSRMQRSTDTSQEDFKVDKEADIRLMKKTESEIILLNRLMNEAFKEHYNFRPATPEETTFNVLKNESMKPMNAYMAYINNEPVGFITTGIDNSHNREKKDKRGWLMSLGVLKPYRNRGIASALMLHGIKTLREQGMETVALGVDNFNVTGAFRLYNNLGFKKIVGYLGWQKDI